MAFSLALFLLGVISGSTSHFVQDESMEHFHSGAKTYFISREMANALEASTSCASRSQTLLILDTDEELEEISRVLQEKGISGVWTSGMETRTNVSTRYSWVSDKGKASPIMDSLMELPEDSGNLGDFLLRRRRSTNKCDCHKPSYCPTKPKCSHVECNITVPECSLLEDRTCEVVGNSSTCEIINQPNCTVTCPPCHLTRGACTVTRSPCQVEPGKCYVEQGKCHVVQEPCTVVKGECKLIEEGCEVEQPSVPCTRPPVCHYRPNSTCGGDTRADMSQLKAQCTDKKCPCEGFGCGPSPPPCENCCRPIFFCVPDVLCAPPPVICKPPIYHCLPATVVCPEPSLVCEDTVTTCDPPQVVCPDPIKICEPDVIVCPAPKTTCTPGVSHCTLPQYECSNNAVLCPKPEVQCPELPACDIPPECYNPPDCPCPKQRYKRSLSEEQDPETGVFYESEDVLDTRCLGLSLRGTGSAKWDVEPCEQKKRFICQVEQKEKV